MQAMRIPEEIIELLEAHLEPKETAKAIRALSEMLSNMESTIQAQQLRFVEELKVWLSTELATKSELANLETRLREELANLEGRLKEELAELKERIARIDGKMEGMATKEDLAKIEGKMEGMATKEDLAKLDKKTTVYFLVLLFVIIFMNQDALAFIARLIGLAK